MEHLDSKEVGVTLKRIRKEKGWSIENIAKMTKNVSSTTLSNIERGLPNVGKQYIEEYCRFLEVDFKTLPLLLQDNSIEKKDTRNKLSRIEKMIDLIGPEEAHKQLKKIPVPFDSDLKIIFTYLEGLCLYHKRSYIKANVRFNRTLELLSRQPEMEFTNIRATCYYELGKISFFYHNDLELALQYSEKGLKAYRKDGKRNVVKFALLSGKASYLEKMHRDEEALETLEQIWDENAQWHRSIDALLNAIEIKSMLSAKRGYYKEAINYAEEGIELARLNRHYPRALELITTLGNIYYFKHEYSEAEGWYLMAIRLEKKIKKKYLFVSTHTRLGILYMTQNKWDEAKMHLYKAVEIGKENNDGIRYFLALTSLGDYYIKTNQLEKAIPHLLTALNLSMKNNFPVIDSELHLKLSHCYEPIDTAEAQKYLAKYKSSKL